MRKIGVVTVARSDYGIYRPLLRRIEADDGLELQLFVSGTHLSPAFGQTVDEIHRDGFPVAEQIDIQLSSDTGVAIARSMGLAMIGFSEALARLKPDILVVLGDRSEMMAAALSAVPLGVPLAHLHGGELTEGAIDDAMRHALTKLSHLHFVSARPYAERVVQMGEEPWRVVESGALSIDAIKQTPLLSMEQLAREHGVTVQPPFLLATYHPVTLELKDLSLQIDGLLEALDEVGLPVLFTAPNADEGGSEIRRRLASFVEGHPGSQLVENLGSRGYLSAVKQASAVVGNSSSGMFDAAPLGAPVVNIGTRQGGRLRSANILDVGYGRSDIVSAIGRATSEDFRRKCDAAQSPYGEGRAAETICQSLKSVPLGEKLLRKVFVDLESQPAAVPAVRA